MMLLMISMQLHSLDILLFFLLKGDYQKSNVSFHIFFHNFLNISISTFILCLIYRNFRICNYFLLKINISGVINVSVRLGVKKFIGKCYNFPSRLLSFKQSKNTNILHLFRPRAVVALFRVRVMV